MNDYINQILNTGSGEARIGNALMDFTVTDGIPPFESLVHMFGRDTKTTNSRDLFVTTFCCSTFSDYVRKIVGFTANDTVFELFTQRVREDLFYNTPLEGGALAHAPRFDEKGEVVDWIDSSGFEREQLLDTAFVTRLFHLYPTITIMFCDNVYPDGSGDTWTQTYSIMRSDDEGAPPATFYLDTAVNRTFEKTAENLQRVLENGCLSAVSGFGQD